MKVALPAAGLAGFSVMAIEILSARWLAPAFGFTLTTWAFLISATLLAGSAGAGTGALLSRRNPRRRAGFAFLLAAGLIAVEGLLAPRLVNSLLDLPLTTGTLLACALLILPPVTALAAVMPLVAPQGREGAGAGRVIGLLVASSTLGSLAGTLVTALWLVPDLGLERSCLFIAAMLAAFGGFALQRGRSGPVAAGAVLLLVGLAQMSESRESDGAVVRDTPYGRIVARRGPSGLTIHVDGVLQAAGPPPAVPGEFLARGQYFELLPWLHPAGTTAIHIGLGSGLVPHCLHLYGIETTTIEVNPDLVDIVRHETGFAGEVRIGDGRALLARTEETFDFVILDAFQGEGLPAHLLTKEALSVAAARLEPGGVLCVHLIGRPGHPVTGAVAATLESVLPNLIAVRNGVGGELQDLFLFAARRQVDVPPAPELSRAGWMGNEAFDPPPGVVLTDDRNPLGRLNEPLARALRRLSLGTLKR